MNRWIIGDGSLRELLIEQEASGFGVSRTDTQFTFPANGLRGCKTQLPLLILTLEDHPLLYLSTIASFFFLTRMPK